jgi:hypothetical protein
MYARELVSKMGHKRHLRYVRCMCGSRPIEEVSVRGARGTGRRRADTRPMPPSPSNLSIVAHASYTGLGRSNAG